MLPMKTASTKHDSCIAAFLWGATESASQKSAAVYADNGVPSIVGGLHPFVKPIARQLDVI